MFATKTSVRVTALVGSLGATLLLGAFAGCGDDDGAALDCDGVVCGAYATCQDTADGRSCVCDDGFEGDGALCSAIDYCDGVTCDANAHCEQVGQVGVCVCDAGYELDGSTCVAIDFCEGVTCGANAHCEQVGHEGVCSCDAGYELDETDCVVVPFCEGVTCGANAHCEQVGHEGVCFCDDGFTGDGTTCTNIDECDLGLDDCAADATCIDTAPGFDCLCLPGFEGDGRTCGDIDECAPGLNPCDPNATCENTDGGHTCACDAGFTGDGTDCADSEPPTFAGVEAVSVDFDGMITLTWQPASDNLDALEDIVYEVCLGATAGACATTFVVDRTTAPGQTTFTVDAGYSERFFVVVRARDLAGNQDDNIVEKVATTHPVTYPITYGDAPVTNSEITYTSVNLAGSGFNVATVSPGATVNLDFTFRIWGSCGGCWYVAAVGISPADESTTTWFNCFYNSNPTATTPPGDAPASRSVSFTAPTTPGVYHVRTRRLADYLAQCLIAGGSSVKTSIATLIVQ